MNRHSNKYGNTRTHANKYGNNHRAYTNKHNTNYKGGNSNHRVKSRPIYSPTNNDIEDLLMNLNKYSLTNTNIIKSFCFIEPKRKPNNVVVEEVKLTKKKADYFYPSLDCKDTLFWCWVSHHYGLQEYELNKNNLYNYETNRKFEYVSSIRNNKLLLKSLRLNRTHLEEKLLDDNGIDLALFTFICLVHKYNVIYTDNYMYYEYIDEFNNDFIMINKRNNKYGLYIKDKITSDILMDFKKDKWIVDSITKPLRSVGSYKAAEIKEICSLLKINIMKTEKKSFTKNELYEKIKQLIM
jgi:hypothetical protein